MSGVTINNIHRLYGGGNNRKFQLGPVLKNAGKELVTKEFKAIPKSQQRNYSKVPGRLMENTKIAEYSWILRAKQGQAHNLSLLRKLQTNIINWKTKNNKAEEAKQKYLLKISELLVPPIKQGKVKKGKVAEIVKKIEAKAAVRPQSASRVPKGVFPSRKNPAYPPRVKNNNSNSNNNNNNNNKAGKPLV